MTPQGPPNINSSYHDYKRKLARKKERDDLATTAMTSIVSNISWAKSFEDTTHNIAAVAKLSYQIADAMMEESNRER